MRTWILGLILRLELFILSLVENIEVGYRGLLGTVGYVPLCGLQGIASKSALPLAFGNLLLGRRDRHDRSSESDRSSPVMNRPGNKPVVLVITCSTIRRVVSTRLPCGPIPSVTGPAVHRMPHGRPLSRLRVEQRVGRWAGDNSAAGLRSYLSEVSGLGIGQRVPLRQGWENRGLG